MSRFKIIIIACMVIATISANAQWTYQKHNNKFDGSWTTVTAPIRPIAKGNAKRILVECDFSSPRTLSFIIEGSYFCGEFVEVKIEIDLGNSILRKSYDAMAFDGQKNLLVGEYNNHNLKELFDALMEGNQARITVYSSACGSDAYLVSLSGSGSALRSILKDYNVDPQPVKENIMATGDESTIDKGKAICSETELWVMRNGEREWSKSLSEKTPCFRTGKYENEYGKLWVEIEIDGIKYWVNNLALEQFEPEDSE